MNEVAKLSSVCQRTLNRMVQITGKYVRTRESNYREFLSKVGVGFLTLQAATTFTPSMEITEINGHWKMVISTCLKTIVMEFQLVTQFLLFEFYRK